MFHTVTDAEFVFAQFIIVSFKHDEWMNGNAVKRSCCFYRRRKRRQSGRSRPKHVLRILWLLSGLWLLRRHLTAALWFMTAAVHLRLLLWCRHTRVKRWLLLNRWRNTRSLKNSICRWGLHIGCWSRWCRI